MLNSVRTDIVFALRALRRSPGFAAATVLTLALGIAATVTIFSVVDAVVLRSLGLRDEHRLVEVGLADPKTGEQSDQLSFPNFRDLRASSQTLSEMTAFRYWLFNLGGGDHPEGLLGLYVGDSLFHILGVKPMLGRTVSPSAERRGAPVEAVISYALWKRRFGGDRGVIGTAVLIDGVPTTIVGILPRNFQFPDVIGSGVPLPARSPDVYLPVGDEAQYDLDDRGNNNYWVFGKMAPGITIDAVHADLGRAAATLAHDHPDHDIGLALAAVPLKDKVVGDTTRPMAVLFGAVLLVLLIACANVGGLQLARGTARAREFGVRTALGASPVRVVRQLLTESVVLAVLGGGIGLFVAEWSVRGLEQAAPNTIARIGDVAIDGRVLAFALVITLISGLLFGLAPVLQQREISLAARLRHDDRALGGRMSRRLRAGLVAGEVALAMILLTGAGLLMRSFAALSSVPAGFEAPNVMTMFTLLPPARYAKPEDITRYQRAILSALDAVPGVTGAASINTLPLSNLGNSTDMEIVGRPAPKPGEGLEVQYRSVAGPYFRVMGIRVVAGRDFVVGDSAGTPMVAVINQTAARRYFPGEDPLGKQIRIMDANHAPRVIVGIVADVRGIALDSAATPEVSFPASQDPGPLVSLAIQTRGDPHVALPAIRRALAAVDPNQAYYAERTMDELMAATLAARRFDLALLAGFAGLAVVLAAVGLYGVIAFSVAQRTREIGVRTALGADRGRIVSLVLREGMVLGGVGLAIGFPLALAVTRVMQRLLFEVRPTDPVTYFATAVGLAAVLLVASFIPARRATRVDPVEALRDG
ncbi:MAG: ABC transporter permease [Gemmatimonadales bacterium]